MQKIKKIKFQTQLIRYLKRHRDELKLLGFEEIPDQTTISYFMNHKLSDKTKELLNFVIHKIEEISEKFDIINDIQIPHIEKAAIKIQNKNRQKRST